jgi:hypothetical protein
VLTIKTLERRAIAAVGHGLPIVIVV